MSQLSGRNMMVVGASRGLGRGMATALAEAGASVVAVSRTAAEFPQPTNGAGTVQPELADAGDATVAASLIDRYEPEVVVLAAGASPHMRPLQHQTWETFSTNWQSDVRIAFHWLREALLLPLREGSRVIVMSSGAALMGSPLSGGYAGAKAAQRFIADYAAQESKRNDLGIGVSAVLPKLTPATELGLPAVRAYALRMGISEEEYVQRMGQPVTPQIAGAAFVQLASTAQGEAGVYMLSGEGLQALAAPIPGAAPATR